ncbi:hypothetical protein TVAG_080090 [Trichomonas vaginalis G3]|uniref:Uncharacterized protein n=1 Tax=Trichomonas vaginalis (strain ATCC PRA-98 / G3) TaxID=412133 RepID=A2FBG2_TRIV3|nr:hypothetical protein TVAGG3_1006580 [Trichomonas vaginalis G3]EAX97749.1 hypothetical protein TVAG_080090 [Trichomonas vaginalis G3]KAI5491176.1 hypothetical protein TVAGG3_1006580 [Trichomonas vaginalis G3]|eukprot:XP_001310679.1 hypothetical protein [Trichomonas vaginalis G3]
MTQPGFQIPTSQLITEQPKQENLQLIERKRRLLTELAALEMGFSYFDYLDPSRNSLPSSATDVPCSVELLSAPKIERKYLDNIASSKALADLITDIAHNPSPLPYIGSRTSPICNDIVKHANGFFAQYEASREQRAGILTAFCIIPRKTKQETTTKTSELQEKPMEEDPSKRVHPFFPDVRDVKPLLGLIKEQLGEFPNFIKDPPTDAECEENLWVMGENEIHDHLFKICGSSSDDDFDPDEQLMRMTPLQPVQPIQQMQVQNAAYMNQNR